MNWIIFAIVTAILFALWWRITRTPGIGVTVRLLGGMVLAPLFGLVIAAWLHGSDADSSAAKSADADYYAEQIAQATVGHDVDMTYPVAVEARQLLNKVMADYGEPAYAVAGMVEKCNTIIHDAGATSTTMQVLEAAAKSHTAGSTLQLISVLGAYAHFRSRGESHAQTIELVKALGMVDANGHKTGAKAASQ